MTKFSPESQFACTRLGGPNSNPPTLSQGACVKRWRIANGLMKGEGTIKRSPCRDCPAGKQRHEYCGTQLIDASPFSTKARGVCKYPPCKTVVFGVASKKYCADHNTAAKRDAAAREKMQADGKLPGFKPVRPPSDPPPKPSEQATPEPEAPWKPQEESEEDGSECQEEDCCQSEPCKKDDPNDPEDECWEEVEKLNRELAATASELERWKRGTQVEGDFICEDGTVVADPRPSDPEVRAMGKIVEAIDSMAWESKKRIYRWLGERYNLR